MKRLIAVLGPTASGKTAFAIQLAKVLDVEIFSADSRQIYKELNIGVARPSKEELNAVPHHFIAQKSIHQTYSAGDFAKEFNEQLTNYFKTKDTAILVGGSGFFVHAALYGLDHFPPVNEEVREKLNKEYEKLGLSYLQETLLKLDPESYSTIEIQNHRRLIRALEVCISSGQTFSSFKKKKAATKYYSVTTFVLTLERDLLFERINGRCNQMIADGLLNEVEALQEFSHLNACKTVGYQEFFDLKAGKYPNLQTAIDKFKQHSRNYAKRQITWLRKQENSVSLPFPYKLKSALEVIEQHNSE